MIDSQNLGESTKTKKAYVMVAIATIVLAGIIGAIIYFSYQANKNHQDIVVSQTQQQLLMTAKSVAKSLEDFIRMQQGILKSFATDPLLSKLTPDTDFSQLEIRYKELKGDIGGFYIISPKGIVTHRYPDKDRVGRDFSNKPGVSAVLKNHKPYISELFYSDSGKACLTILEPIYREGEFIGIVRALTYVETIQKKYIAPVKVGQKGYAQLVDNDGIVIIHPKSEHIGKDIIAIKEVMLPDYDWTELENIVGKMAKGEEGVGIYHSVWWTENKLERVKKLTAYAPVYIGDELWSISVSMGYSDITEPIKKHSRNTFGVALLIGLLVVAVGYVFYRKQKKVAVLQAEAANLRKISETALALRESEEKYRSMMEAMQDPAYICSPTFRVEYMNAAMIKRIGPDAIGGLCYKVINGCEEKCSWCVHDKVMQGESKITEITSPKDGLSYSVSHVPIHHTDDSISKFTIYRDTTKLMKLEKRLHQSQKMEAVGTLAGGIAHDFNNILSPIMIHSEMVMEDLPNDSPIQFNLKEIFKASERARDMVKQILAFSRKGEAGLTAIKIIPILKEVLKMLRSSIPTTVDIHQDLELESDIVLANPTQIHQIMLNLASNAAHAMREKGGNLKVSLIQEDLDSEAAKQYHDLNPGSYLKLVVSDTGSGIDSETIKKIFDPYFTTKKVGEGTGMGLALIHGIVKNYGGDITVESEKGKGTTFKVYLPRVEADVSPGEKPSATLPRGTERILFVDDEKAAVDATQLMLGNLGYRITARTSSIEALEAFRNNPEGFDLVITDMTMPNMTGKDLAREMMSIRSDIPIILCTGFSEQIDEHKAKKMGINAYVMKPIVRREIAKTIREVFDKSS